MNNFITTQNALGRVFKLIEIGAGVPVADLILSSPGASKIVYETECPYGSAKEKYGITDRMVSREAVIKIFKETNFKNFNTLVVTSFQIPSENDVVPHGWVLIGFKNGNYDTFHITLQHLYLKEESRRTYIERLGKIVIELISIIDERCVPDLSKIDSGWIDRTRYKPIQQKNLNTLICYDCGVPVRFEDISRKYSSLNLYKGSFNPIHSAHQEIAKIAEHRNENSRTIFALSRNTYQKGKIPEDQLMERIRAINSAGYPVLVFDDGFFYDNVLAVQNRFSGKVNPIMGADTFNRLMNCYQTNDLSVIERGIYDNCSWFPMRERLEMTFNKCFGDTTFLVFGRNVELNTFGFPAKYDFVDFDMNISSSEIRAGKKF
jgi:hypothetical protein